MHDTWPLILYEILKQGGSNVSLLLHMISEVSALVEKEYLTVSALGKVDLLI